MSSEDNNPLNFKFDNTYIKLPTDFYKKSVPAKFSNPNLIFYNSKLAADLQISNLQINDSENTSINTKESLNQNHTNPVLDSDILKMVFSGQQILSGSETVSLAYAGHQFGHFVPQLGDGRATLLGEILDSNLKRWDLQLKGSGLTPFSRGGDGLAPLGPMLREYIMSEAMHALGVPTTRALALVSTGDLVYRETTLPGAILTRVASSHIRVGTFEYFASRNDFKNLKILSDYVIRRHYPEALNSENPYLALLKNVLKAQAQLIAKWMSLGFIHGVMNTDNMTVSGETIDYGPCAFMDFYDPQKVFSSIDRKGRYAFKNQPQIAEWNLSVFASCLLPLISDPTQDNFGSYDDYREKNELYSEKNIQVVQDEIDKFESMYHYYWLQEMKQKLGFTDFNAKPPEPDSYILNEDDKSTNAFVQSFLNLMAEQKIDFTLSFRSLAESLNHNFENTKFATLFYPQDSAKAWFSKWQDKIKSLQKSSDQSKTESQTKTLDQIAASMNLKNPAFIPRNHWIDKAIKSAELKNDFSLAEKVLKLFTSPFNSPKNEDLEFTHPPKPEEQVTKTFCGT